MFGTLSSRRRWMKRLLVVILVTVGLEQLWRHGWDYVFADRFAVVEPGKIYRGAWQHDWPMRRIINGYHVKTIVALAHSPDHPLVHAEKALASELGVKWIHIPIVDQRTGTSPNAINDQLDKAVEALSNPANQPVYFHCHHGINRATMVQIAYRVKHSGWSLEQASDEVAKTFGLVTVSKGPDYRHMTRYYQERVLPMRQAAVDGSPVK